MGDAHRRHDDDRDRCAAADRCVGQPGAADADLVQRLHCGDLIDEQDRNRHEPGPGGSRRRRVPAVHRPARGAALRCARHGRRRLDPLVLAAADLHAGRAAAAPAALARRDPRFADPADRCRLQQGRRLPPGAQDARAGLRQARAVPRLQLGVVLGDLHPAVHLPHRLHRAPRLAVHRPAARPAAGRPQAAVPAARVHHLAHDGRARGGARGRAEAAEAAPLPCPRRG
ncbi:hypothetical protein SGPA1_12703 [Streptomyces misionensis JCM 4497]